MPDANKEQSNTASVRSGGKGAFWAVIPAGGSGTRLWPLSRTTRPKFLLPLFGDRSLLQQTFDRLLALTNADHMLVVCGPAHVAEITRQLPELPAANIIVEPSPIGTGPALALATALIAQIDPEAIVGSFAADHVVADPAAFTSAMQTAIAVARTGDLVTVGLTPTRAETGYGYIERTDDVVYEGSSGTAYRAARFIEKPDREHAEQYLAAGNFLWNAAMFTWRVDALLAELERLQPRICDGVRRIADAWHTPHRETVTASIWLDLPNVTIDTGVMEGARRMAVVPAEMGWSDVGDWHGLGEMIERDGLGNSVRGDLLQIDTTNCLVWSETDRLVAMVGLDNIVVVDTEGALLIIDRNKSQDVRKVVERLKAMKRKELS